MPRKKSYARKPKSKDKKQDRRIAKIEKHIATSEMKAITYESASFKVTAAGVGLRMWRIAQGDDYFNRTGDSIKPYMMKFTVWMQNEDTDNYYRVRVRIARINMAGGIEDFVVGQYLDVTGASPVYAHESVVFSKIKTKDKFITTGDNYETLYDSHTKVIAPFNAAGSSSSHNEWIVNKTLKCNQRKPVRFRGTTSADNTSSSGTYVLLVVGDDALDTEINCVVSWTGYFTDP